MEDPYDFDDPVKGAINTAGGALEFVVKGAMYLGGKPYKSSNSLDTFIFRGLADLNTVSALAFGYPMVTSDMIRQLGSKERGYYYDMRFKALFHSNGVRRANPNRRLERVAINGLRKLEAEQAQMDQSLNMQVNNARKR